MSVGQKWTILFFTVAGVGALFLFSAPSVHAQEYFECRITLKENAPRSCGDASRDHRCQLYHDRFKGDIERQRVRSQPGWAPDYCWSSCLARSGLPSRQECVSVTSAPSRNPQAHETRGGSISGAVSDIAKEVGSSGAEDAAGKVKVLWGEVQEKAATVKEKAVCDVATKRGIVAHVDGEVSIARGLRNMVAKKGIELKSGDIIAAHADSSADIFLETSGTLRLAEKTKFQIPRNEPQCADNTQEGVVSKTFTAITDTVRGALGSVWFKTRELLKGESFEIKTPTAAAGSRG